MWKDGIPQSLLLLPRVEVQSDLQGQLAVCNMDAASQMDLISPGIISYLV
jgi:hypothetical protein